MSANLPDGLDVLWHDRRDDQSTPREGLNRSRIVGAATDIADAHGLEAVSMARVAERLGFATMALYRHVRSKNDLLLLMLDAASTVPPELDQPLEDWRAGIERWCRAQWEMLTAHPWILHLPITGPPVTPSQLGWTDRGLAALRNTGLSEAEKAKILLQLGNYMLSTARLRTELGPAASSDSIAAYSALLSSLVDAKRFPHLRVAVDAGAYDYPRETDEEQRELGYEFGLDRILDGVETLVKSQRSRRG